MIVKHFAGEPYPALVEEFAFEHVICVKIFGTEEEICLTTEAYCKRYPIEDFGTKAWGDAKFIYADRAGQNLFQLLVFRNQHCMEGLYYNG